MIKALIASVAVHAAVIFVVGFIVCPWLEKFTPKGEQGRVDVDVVVVGEKSGRGEKKQAAPERAKPEPIKAEPKTSAAANGALATGGPVSPPSAPAASGATGGDRVTIEGDGNPLSLTLDEFLKWLTTHNEPPRYPRLARMRGEQGKTMIKVSLLSRGSPAESIALEQSSGSELLDKAALEAVRGWRFPSFRGRDQVTIVIPFRFSLDES